MAAWEKQWAVGSGWAEKREAANLCFAASTSLADSLFQLRSAFCLLQSADYPLVTANYSLLTAHCSLSTLVLSEDHPVAVRRGHEEQHR